MSLGVHTQGTPGLWRGRCVALSVCVSMCLCFSSSHFSSLSLSLSLPFSLSLYTHRYMHEYTHTHTSTYVYMHIYMYACINVYHSLSVSPCQAAHSHVPQRQGHQVAPQRARGGPQGRGPRLLLARLRLRPGDSPPLGPYSRTHSLSFALSVSLHIYVYIYIYIPFSRIYTYIHVFINVYGDLVFCSLVFDFDQVMIPARWLTPSAVD